MRLITQTQVTVDGVMQGNGGASDEDRKSGFERGGWAMGAFDDETLAFITRTYQSADAFLFGRQTYDVFAPYWGAMEPGSHPIADAFYLYPLGSRTPLDEQLLNCDVDVSWWVTPDAYDAGLYTQVYEALRHWLANEFPFWNPHYSNRELPDS